MDERLPRSGAKWRVQLVSSEGTKQLTGEETFDELVVGDWLHVEWMSEDVWWMRIGDAKVIVDVRPDSVGVQVDRGVYGPVVPITEEGRDA